MSGIWGGRRRAYLYTRRLGGGMTDMLKGSPRDRGQKVEGREWQSWMARTQDMVRHTQSCEVPVYFSFSCCVGPLGWKSGGVLREGKLAGNLGRGWRRARGDDSRLVFQSTLVLVTVDPRSSQRTSTPTVWAEGEVAAPTFCRRQGCWSRHCPWRAEYLRTVRAPERARLSNPGVPPCLGPAGSRDWCWISGCRVWGLSWEIERRPEPRRGAS